MSDAIRLNSPSGSAFLLQSPSRRSWSLGYPAGHVLVREGAPYLSVHLERQLSSSAARDLGWNLAQDALDKRAVSHREALAIVRGDYEYFSWGVDDERRTLNIVEVADMPWGIQGHLRLGSDTISYAESPTSPTLPSHPAFRFYRLARASDDLFDAFRNGYLCLECLLSDIEAKPTGEKELHWLSRVLEEAFPSILPSGVTPRALAESIYKFGRNPLFHAKSDQSFHTPHSSGREEVYHLFVDLDGLLMRILHARFGPAVPSAWGSMSQRITDAGSEAVFQYDEAYFPELDRSAGVNVKVIDAPRRLGNRWAQVDIDVPVGLTVLRGMCLKYCGDERGTFTFPEDIPIEPDRLLRLEMMHVSYNHGAPRPIYAR